MSIGAVGSSSCQGPSQAWKDKMFAKTDTDGDGKLSIDEFSALTQKMESRRGASNADGASGSTARPDAATLFKSMDTNGDGSLSQTELDTGMSAMHQAMASAVKKHKGGNSEALMDMLFPKTSDGVTDSTSGAISGSSSSSSSSSSASTGDGSNGVDTTAMRLQQYMLDAFSSQFNVSSMFAQAA